MKCNFCGHELPKDADFCPECGMIISLGDMPDEENKTIENEAEVPEFTPNVFKTMDFEAETAQPAVEFKADESEETAPVVQTIPEFIPEQENTENIEDGFAPEVIAEAASKNEFTPPEYKSDSYVEPVAETVEETPATQAQALFGEAVAAQPVQEATGDTIVMNLAQPQQPSQEPEVRIPTEDNSLIEALFDGGAYAYGKKNEEFEDITKAHNEKIKKEKAKKKSSNKGYAMVFALVIVLVGIIFAAGYVMDNILPKLQDGTTTTTKPTITTTIPVTKEPALTTKPSSTTTTKADTSSTTTTTTKPGSSSTTTTTKPGATTSTTKKTTTTTTKKTTTTTTQVNYTIKEPSDYYYDAVVYFPSDDNISIKASPSSSAQTIAYQPYGYPLYAWAYENGYYYVESPVNDLWAWVSASYLDEYETTTTTTTRPATTTTRPSATTTTRPTTTTEPSGDNGYTEYATPYIATIYPPDNDALNFRSGPGTSYGIVKAVPYGYTVTVYGYSSVDSDWVYVEVTDSRYAPYGSAEGWVYKAYIS